MKLRMLWSVFGLILTCSAVAGGHHAEELTGEEISIKGLKKIGVVVALGKELEKSNLSRDTIRTDVELKLRQSSIHVCDLKEARSEPGKPMLFVQIDATESDGIYAYCVTVECMQEMLFKRDPSIQTPTWEDDAVKTKGMMCRTWSTGNVGMVKTDSVAALRNTIKDDVDEFCNAFLKANPLQSHQNDRTARN